jgi:hypothetical protein
MGAYDDIQVPISGQPASSSLFGEKVRNSIIDLDRRVQAVEASQQKILARGRRETNKTNIGATELPVMRLDNIPVLDGFMYRISTGPVNFDNQNVGMTGEMGEMRFRAQYSTSLPSTPAIITSSFLGRFRDSLVESAFGPAFGGQVFYYASADGYISVLLSAIRTAGSNPVQIVADSSNPLDLTVEFAGEDPGDTGVDL